METIEEEICTDYFSRYFKFLICMDLQISKLSLFAVQMAQIIEEIKNQKRDKELIKIIDKECEQFNCVDLIMQYKIDLEVSHEKIRLKIGRSSLKLYKKFKYSFLSKKKAKRFTTSLKMHSYLMSQYIRDPEVDSLCKMMGQNTVECCMFIAEKYNISKELFKY